VILGSKNVWAEPDGWSYAYNYLGDMAGLTGGGFVIPPEGGRYSRGGAGFTPFLYFYDNNLNLINKVDISFHHITLIMIAGLPDGGFVSMGNTDGGDYYTHLFYFDSSGSLVSQRDISADIPALATKNYMNFSLSALSDGGVQVAEVYTPNVWIYHSPPEYFDLSGTGVSSIGGIGGSYFQAASTPTLIKLSSFTATTSNKKVTLQWTTASEIDTAGFNLYRAESEDGEYVKINPLLIPAEGNGTSGATYKYIDDDVRNRKTYWYKLEDIDLNGKSTFHGPVSVEPKRTNVRRES
jgi:hypothetical protein